MTLTLKELEQYDLQAGWPAPLIPTAAAIEEAESGGDPGAIGPSYGGDQGSWGLFQIQTGFHPDLVRQYGRALLSDPLTESKAGLQVYQSQGWSAWSTYTSGRYQSFLPAAQQAAVGLTPSSSAAATPGQCTPSGWQNANCGPLDIGCAVGNFWGGLTCALEGVFRRMAVGLQIAAGLLIVAVGLWFLVKDTEIGQQVTRGLQAAATTAIQRVP